MKTLYENSRYAVVDNYAPGLKIYDKLLERVDMYRCGAFYDNMGDPYPASGLEAAKQVADRLEAEDRQRLLRFNLER